MPPLLPSNSLRSSKTPQRQRRQAMTEREINAFEDMFDMIFNAVSKDAGPGSKEEAEVGIRKNNSDLFGKLRKHSKRMRWTSEVDEKLDRQKEAMDLCRTDQELLQWAMKEIFGESERYTEESKKAVEHAASTGGSPKDLPMLQPPTYPHLLAHLIRTFRDKYHDPHLALAMFDHARRLSIASYVFGCSTLAYNELIQTRWQCFRDLKGVYDALQEMSVNGVDFDTRTRKLVEDVRREVGERNTFMEEDAIDGGDVREILNKIEKLTRKFGLDSDSLSQAKWDDWKSLPMTDEENDNWGFDQWEEPQRPISR